MAGSPTARPPKPPSEALSITSRGMWRHGGTSGSTHGSPPQSAPRQRHGATASSPSMRERCACACGGGGASPTAAASCSSTCLASTSSPPSLAASTLRSSPCPTTRPSSRRARCRAPAPSGWLQTGSPRWCASTTAAGPSSCSHRQSAPARPLPRPAAWACRTAAARALLRSAPRAVLGGGGA
eukprot:scaffold233758_cov31-Tisochrysis_lutea.AAC.1